MDASSIAARKQPVSWVVQLFKWTTPDFTLRLSTGGFIPWGNDVFLARDPVMGVLGELPTFEDGIDSQTTRSTLTIIPPDQAGLAKAADRKYQRTLVQVGAVLGGGSDASVGYGFPAIAVSDKLTYRIIIRHRRYQALTTPPASGYYLRLFEAAVLNPATTHVGYPDQPGCTAYATLSDLISNGPPPGTAWTIQTFDYTPTPGTNFATFGMMSAFATTADIEIDYVLITPDIPRIQYFNSAGRMFDGRGLPLNAAAGKGLTISPTVMLSAPATNANTSISVAASTVTYPGGFSQSLPAATITGLTAGTDYTVYRDLLTNSYVARTGSQTAYKTSADRYLWMGLFTTALTSSGGSYPSPPPPPPGWGGGTGDRPYTTFE